MADGTLSVTATLPEGATGMVFYRVDSSPVWVELRGWHRLVARLRGRPLLRITGYSEHYTRIGEATRR